MQTLIHCPECNSINVEEDPDNLDPNLLNQDPDKPLKCRECLHRFSLEEAEG